MDFSQFFSKGLNLFEKGNLKLGKAILKAMDPAITRPRITNPYKNAVYLIDFNSNKVDFPTLLCIVSVPNSVCDFDKPIFSKYILKLLALVLFVRVNPLVIVIFARVNPLVLVLLLKVNPLVILMSVQVNPLVLVLFVKVNPLVIVISVQVHPSVLALFVKINSIVTVMFV